MSLSIGKKLGLGFAAVLLLMVISSTVAYISIENVDRGVEEVVSETLPAMLACDRARVALAESLAALRGYIILGDDPRQAELFKSQRRQAWDDMDKAVNELAGLYQDQPGAEARRLIDQVRSQAQQLRQAQQEAEAIAQTRDNIPAHKLLHEEVVPGAWAILQAIGAMITQEESLPANEERKKVFKAMADFQASFALLLAGLQAYLLNATPAAGKQLASQVQGSEAAYQALEKQAPLLMGKQGDHWQELREHRKSFLPLAGQIEQLRGAGDWNRAVHIMETRSVPLGVEVSDTLEKLKENAFQEMSAERKSLAGARRALTFTLVGTTALGIALGALLAVALTRRIVASVNELLSGVQEVAAGDLTGKALPLSTGDEIGKLGAGFNKMVTSLREILAQASQMTAEVAAASSEIASSAQQQLASLSQTATSLNEITPTAEQLKAVMQEFADRARAVQDAADETVKRSEDGRTLTQESAARIEQVRSSSQAAGGSVLGLSEQMLRIGEITATVNEIAEQTKLLALNASIEAARAGEEGRGFAVVATQVRELAGQSKEAGRRIEGLIAQAQKSMQDVVAKIEVSARLAEDASDTVQQVRQGFGEIAQAIEHTREAMTQITTGARQQEQAIVQLVTSIAEIDEASKESVSASEQTRRSILAIDQRIRALNQAMSRFKV